MISKQLLLLVNYIGPGLGGDVITAVLGFLTSIFLTFFAITWYPIKKVIAKFKKKKPVDDSETK